MCWNGAPIVSENFITLLQHVTLSSCPLYTEPKFFFSVVNNFRTLLCYSLNHTVSGLPWAVSLTANTEEVSSLRCTGDIRSCHSFWHIPDVPHMGYSAVEHTAGLNLPTHLFPVQTTAVFRYHSNLVKR